MGNGGREEQFLLKVEPSPALARHQAVDAEGRAFARHFVNLGGILPIGDDHLEMPRLEAEEDVLGSQEGRGRTDHCSQLEKGEHEGPPFRNPMQHDEDPVALLNAVFEENVGRLVGGVAKIAEGQFSLITLLINPDHGQFVAVAFGPLVHHVIGEIEIFRYFNGKGGASFVIILEVVFFWHSPSPCGY